MFVTPSSRDPGHAVEAARVADESGLDLISFQDHPYQPAFLDTWTLLSHVAAVTSRIHLSGNVLNIPLRPPSVLARSAASLDLLSGGRLAMGLGAGGFTDAIVAMGGPRRTPGESRRALDEAITIMREIWDTDTRGGVHFRGDFYTVDGAKRGPRPAHHIPIWVGAYKPRMLELVGRRCDGWLPSLSYLENGVDDLAGMNAAIDDAAIAAGRDPGDIDRFLNLGGHLSSDGSDPLSGPMTTWPQALCELAVEHRVTGFIVATDDLDTIRALGTDVVPAARELIAARR